MKLHFLGTGAADWDIRHPQKSLDYRRFSSLLLDDTLLIDPGPCVFEFAHTYGYTDLFSSLKLVINTHRHSDHYSPETVHQLGVPVLSVDDFCTVEAEGYRISAYPANHATVENPHHFVVESLGEGKRIFYGCDGAWLPYRTAHALRSQQFDAMIFDCTIGDVPGDFRIFEHNNISMVEQMCAAFAGNSSRFFVSHMARTLHSDHKTLVNRLTPSGIVPAYDDMVVQL